MSIGIRSIYRKAANSVFQNTDVLASIGMSAAVAAGQVVKGYFEVYFDSTNGGLSLAIVPGGAVSSFVGRIYLDDPAGGVYVSGAYSVLPAATFVSPTNGLGYVAGSFLYVPTVDQNIELQAAQGTADAVACTVLAGSWMEITIL